MQTLASRKSMENNIFLKEYYLMEKVLYEILMHGTVGLAFGVVEENERLVIEEEDISRPQKKMTKAVRDEREREGNCNVSGE